MLAFSVACSFMGAGFAAFCVGYDYTATGLMIAALFMSAAQMGQAL